MLNLGHAPTNILLMIASKLSKSDFTINYKSTGDINNITSVGIFSGAGSILIHAPKSYGYFTWINLLTDGNHLYCTQIGVCGNDTNIYIRASNAGAWGAWRTI